MFDVDKYADYIESCVESKTEQTEAAGDYWGQTSYLDDGFDVTRYSKYAEDMN